MIDCLKNINLGCMVEMPGLNARIQSEKGRRDENVECNHVDDGRALLYDRRHERQLRAQRQPVLRLDPGPRFRKPHDQWAR